MEVPTKHDFLKVDGVKLYHPPNAHFSVVSYKSMRINMRGVIDFCEFDEELVVFDEEKNEEFTKSMQDWQKNNSSSNVQHLANGHGIIVTQPQNPPSVPTKKIRLIGTTIIYMNNSERLIMMNIDEWEEKYFEYLEKVRLDFLGVGNNGKD